MLTNAGEHYNNGTMPIDYNMYLFKKRFGRPPGTPESSNAKKSSKLIVK